MIADLDASDFDELSDYDLCVVGTGPAGATVVNELAGAGFRICVLESGLLKPTRNGDRLREVDSVGLHIKDYSRERVLGGASTTWAGLSSPLDEADFRVRPFLRHSGWPIDRAELLPYYAEAAGRYRFPPLEAFGSGGLADLRAEGDLQPTWSALEEKVFLAAAEPQNFGQECRAAFESEHVDLFLDATLLELDATSEPGRVAGGLVRTRSGREVRVRARAWVVGTGGIENARLLLASGIGREHDQVGRYFMNHPKNYCGLLHLREPVENLAYYFGCLYRGFAGYAGLRFPEAEQERRGLLNSYVRFEPLFPWSDNDGVESLVLFAKRSKFLLDRFRKRHADEVIDIVDYSETGDDSDLQNQRKTTGAWLSLAWNIVRHSPSVAQYLYFRLIAKRKARVKTIRIRNFLEMEPDPDNRVVLGEQRDAYGRPRPVVHSRCTQQDRRSLIELHEVLEQEVARAGFGRLTTDLAQQDPWPITMDASHHMGTTRMGTDPATSVVDANGRVHGLDNLYMAGSSVFPTSGCANPTFTIVALSIRLARHLRSELGSTRAPSSAEASA